LELFKTAISDEYHDTLLVMILFRILTDKENYLIHDWWKETIAGHLYPNAQVSPKQVNKFLSKIGDDICFRKYIIGHVNYLKVTPKYCILIDSAGLSNDIHTEAISNHNGAVSNEIRLIFVVESNTGFPIYYKYVTGNIVDESTLNMIINELNQYDIEVNRAILDSRYYSENNLLYLYKNQIPFLTRTMDKALDFRHLIEKYEQAIKTKSKHIFYDGRHFYIKKVRISIFKGQMKAFAYVCKDVTKEHEDEIRYNETKMGTLNDIQFQKDRQNFGTFVLLSTSNIKSIDLLPCYSARKETEMIFNYLKNDIGILRTQGHSESSFRGHLLISFMALTGFIAFKNELGQNKLEVHSAIDALIPMSFQDKTNFYE
jgi:transposase